MDLKPFTPDCGHTVTPVPGSVGTGEATEPETGRTMCYPCAEAAEQEAIKTAETYSGYLTERHPNVITTWTGGVLAKVTSYGVGSERCTPSGGSYRPLFVRAETPDGTQWYGRGSSSWDVVTLRRLKRQR